MITGEKKRFAQAYFSMEATHVMTGELAEGGSDPESQRAKGGSKVMMLLNEQTTEGGGQHRGKKGIARGERSEFGFGRG